MRIGDCFVASLLAMTGGGRPSFWEPSLRTLGLFLFRHCEPAQAGVAISLLRLPTVLSLRGACPVAPWQSRFCVPNTPLIPEIATSEQKTLLLAMTDGVGVLRLGIGDCFVVPSALLAMTIGVSLRGPRKWPVAISLLGTSFTINHHTNPSTRDSYYL